jgi:protein-tyrosine phosphatase
MRQAIVVLTFAAVEVCISLLLPPLMMGLLLWVATVTAVVSLSMMAQFTDILGKTKQGKHPIWSQVLFWPWHKFSYGCARFARNREAQISEVSPGLFIGMWPHRLDVVNSSTAVVDVTVELPRVKQGGAYLCLPTWDGTAPTLVALTAGATWGARAAKRGPLLVHCTFGHSRSATVLSAIMVEGGYADTWQEALQTIKQIRSTAHLTVEQQNVLDAWTQQRAIGS